MLIGFRGLYERTTLPGAANLIATTTFSTSGTASAPVATVVARGQGKQDTPSAQHTIAFPTCAPGEVLLVNFTNDNATTVANTSSTGWLKLGTQAQGTTTNHTGTVFWKRATGTSDSLVVDLTDPTNSPTQEATWTWYRIISAGDPEIAGTNGAASTSGTAPSVDPSTGTGNYLAIEYIGVDSSADTTFTQSVTMPASFTNQLSQNPGVTSSAATFSAERLYTGVSTVAPGGFTLSLSEQFVAFTIVMQSGVVNGVRTFQGAVSLAASASLSSAATIVPTHAGAVNLAATSTLTSNGVRQQPGAVNLTATSTLTTNGTIIPGAVTHQGATNLSATPTLTTNGVRSTSGAVTLTSAATLSTNAFLTEFAAVSLAASTALTTNGIRTTSGAVSLTSIPNLTTQPFLTLPAAVSLISTPSLSVFAQVPNGAVNLNASATLSTTARLVVQAVANLVATATLSTAARLDAAGSVTLSQLPTLNTNGIRSTFGAVTLNSTSELLLTSKQTLVAAVSLLTSQSLDVSTGGATNRPGAATLASSALLTINGVTVKNGAVALNSTPTLTVAAVRTAAGAILLVESVSLAVNTQKTTQAVVNLTVVATLLASGTLPPTDSMDFLFVRQYVSPRITATPTKTGLEATRATATASVYAEKVDTSLESKRMATYPAFYAEPQPV